MKKKIILAMLLAVMMFTLCACGMMKPVKEVETEDETFMVYQEYMSGNIIVDTQTNVMYWMSTGTHNCGTLTLLVDRDGSPKIYRDGDG